MQTTNKLSVEARLDHLVRSVSIYCRYPRRADLVMIEGSSYGSRGPGHEELAALRFMVRRDLWRYEIPFAMVPPTTLKRYTTGSGAATKAGMVEVMEARYHLGLSEVKVRDGRYDRADALALAAMGYARLGQPLASEPGTHGPDHSSLASVKWPELLSDD